MTYNDIQPYPTYVEGGHSDGSSYMPPGGGHLSKKRRTITNTDQQPVYYSNVAEEKADRIFAEISLRFFQENIDQDNQPEYQVLNSSECNLRNWNIKLKKTSFIPLLSTISHSKKNRSVICNFQKSLENIDEDNPKGLKHLYSLLNLFHSSDILQEMDENEKYKKHNLARFQMLYFLIVAYYQTNITDINFCGAKMQSQIGRNKERTEAAHHSLFSNLQDNSTVALANTINEALNEIKIKFYDLDMKESQDLLDIADFIYELFISLVVYGIPSSIAQKYIHLFLTTDDKYFQRITYLSDLLRQHGGENLINEKTLFFYHLNSTLVENHVLNRTDELLESALRMPAIKSLRLAAQPDQEETPWQIYRTFIDKAIILFQKVGEENNEKQQKLLSHLSNMAIIQQEIEMLVKNIAGDAIYLVELLEKIDEYSTALANLNKALADLNGSREIYDNLFEKSNIDFSIFTEFHIILQNFKQNIDPSIANYKVIISEREQLFKMLEMLNKNEAFHTRLIQMMCKLDLDEMFNEEYKKKKRRIDRKISDSIKDLLKSSSFSVDDLYNLLYSVIPTDKQENFKSFSTEVPYDENMVTKDFAKFLRSNFYYNWTQRKQLPQIQQYGYGPETQKAQNALEINSSFLQMVFESIDPHFTTLEKNISQFQKSLHISQDNISQVFNTLNQCLKYQEETLQQLCVDEELITGHLAEPQNPNQRKELYDLQTYLISRRV